MDAMALALLGAVGGSLRAVVDAYGQTMAWRAARRTHRRTTAGGSGTVPSDGGGGPVTGAQPAPVPPALSEFFDPVPELVAGLFHMGLGAATAVVFGLAGQINGGYAAIAVGISAPALLVQVGQIPAVGEGVAGTPQPAQPAPGPVEATQTRESTP
ncbi:hypothetical protein [Streptomyces odontomachi]|uniref:hypothetical protein n=1 Tax=Streptomyces odontomachi TaxID=2944940 RepID=UPI00210C2D80|nr:hypothetical protein [Streptomyces sp. ODS25]